MNKKEDTTINECIRLLDNINWVYVTEQSFKTIHKVIDLLTKALP